MFQDCNNPMIKNALKVLQIHYNIWNYFATTEKFVVFPALIVPDFANIAHLK